MTIEEIIKTKEELPLSRKAIINLLYTEKSIREKINSELRVFDISIQQFNVLRILKGQNGKPANLSTIQERMVSKMSNTTRLVDKLIKKKLVNRIVCETNRRKIEITITPDGTNFLAEVSPVMDRFEKRITSKLSDGELQQLNTLLNKLRE
ncbi:MarR family transcriptional regulator [Aquimarina sp. RZ0]|nr:MarR family transcriptional regulator [Aquimarina sp. RZ0]KAA1245846.1 MarR family transcriptional regulator [Aquimarina sp. RZ0]